MCDHKVPAFGWSRAGRKTAQKPAPQDFHVLKQTTNNFAAIVADRRGVCLYTLVWPIKWYSSPLKKTNSWEIICVITVIYYCLVLSDNLGDSFVCVFCWLVPACVCVLFFVFSLRSIYYGLPLYCVCSFALLTTEVGLRNLHFVYYKKVMRRSFHWKSHT